MAVELVATILNERHRFENPSGDTVIMSGINGKGSVTVKGTADELGPHVDGTYRFYGSWSSYRNKYTGKDEKQFTFKSFIPEAPKGQRAVTAYLMRCPTITRGMAEELWGAFGEEAIVKLSEGDPLLLSINRLTDERIEAAVEWLDDEAKIRDSIVEVLGLLDGRGFPKSIISECVAKFGARAAYLIRKNPYLLQQFKGCGFRRADKLYLDLGGDPAALKRQVYAAENAMKEQMGHTWFPLTMLDRQLRTAVGSCEPDTKKTLRLGTRAKRLSTMFTDDWTGPPSLDGNCCWVALSSKARDESFVAQRLRAMLWESDIALRLGKLKQVSDHQKENIGAAIDETWAARVGVLCGGPGTGKTFCAGKVIDSLPGKMHVAAAAPTGKAAVRLTESLNAAGVDLRARTIHSLLGVESVDGYGWQFKHHAGNPMPWNFLLVDESSMIDTGLMANLLAAVADDCFVLFLGDTNQLSPVGHGAPLRDMIAGKVPCGELTEVRRNSGRIVEACHAIRNGQHWEPGDNLQHQPISDPVDLVRQFVVAMKAQGLGIDDCQIVVPMNDKSPLSRVSLNLELQRQCNPLADRPGEMCEGDKVINTKNGWYHKAGPCSDDADENADGRVYAANGEMGRVIRCNPKSVVVELPTPLRTIRVPLGEEGASHWQLGYAVTVHKAQGSEWPVVVVVLDEAASRMCDRSWIYTAISRAKQTCVLAGELEVAYQMCAKNRIDDRKTFLKELIDG